MLSGRPTRREAAARHAGLRTVARSPRGRGVLAAALALAAAAGLPACKAYDRQEYERWIDPPDGISRRDVRAGVDAVAPGDAAPDAGVDAGAVTATPPPDVQSPVDAQTPVDVPVPPDVPAPRDVVVPVDVPPPPPSSCVDVHSRALFCDGFEDTALARWNGQLLQNGVVGRVTSPVYRGAGALSARTFASMGRAGISNNTLGGLRSGNLFVRGYYYFPSGYPIDDISFVFVGEAAASSVGVAANVTNTDRIGVYSGPADQFMAGGGAAVILRDHWHCIEMRVGISATAGSLDVWLDNALVLTATGFSTLPSTGFGQIIAGAEYTSAPQGPVTVHVDEVVADTTRIGCD